MIAETLVCLLVVLGVAFGLSRPFIGLFRLRPAESVVAAAALSLLGAWLISWVVFTAGLPLWTYRVVPSLACIFLLGGWKGHVRLLADPEARDLVAGQLIVTGWCVTALAFVKSYTGGAWTGDELEHWERAQFFSRALPADHLFIGLYLLPARPPLVNVLAAAFLQMTSGDYAYYQVITTALCSLAYLPVALLAGRFRGRSAARLAAVVLMVSPLFIQNSTYPWTKLEAAFFILCGFYFFLRVRDQDEAIAPAALLCALCLGGAVVTHYSAGPYVVVIAVGWIGLGFRRRWDGRFVRLTLMAAAAGAAVLSPWFGWSVRHFGAVGTFLSNSSVGMMNNRPASPLVVMALNLRDNILPPQLRGFDGRLFRQSSPWGYLRDQFFIIYQLNLVFVLGSVGWLVVARQSVSAARRFPRRDAAFWILSAAGVVLLSGATYLDRDHYGTTHICLQTAVLCALAFLASQWDRLSRGWRIALAAGWVVDFVLGIALQLGVEDYAIDQWLAPTRSFGEMVGSYSGVAQGNIRWKFIAHLRYFSDILPTPPVLMVALMGAILAMALLRARQDPPEARPT
jgi:4-amino-4-deoxy-L-arabinose transferase-like glycosyltransferase